MKPKAFEIYRHFKGQLYQIIALAEEEGTGKMLVVYQGLYDPFKVYARPLSEFLERLNPVKYPNASQECRFERVTGTESMAAEEIPAAITEEIPAGKSLQTVPEADMTKTPVQNAPEADRMEAAGGVNPDLLLFLDAREPEDKLDALFRIKSRLTPDMLTVMEMSQGMEPQEEWTIEERYKHIKNDIITKNKYEQKRI